MPRSSQRSRSPRESQASQPVLADATELAEALGCEATPAAVVASLSALATEATLRYGLPLTAKGRVLPALKLPDYEVIPHEIQLSTETPWKRLAESLRLPAIGELAIMARLSLASKTQLPLLIEGVTQLRSEFASLTQIPVELGIKMKAVQSTLSQWINEPIEQGPVGDIVKHVYRQLAILDQAGPQYTRVTKQELNLMHAMLKTYHEAVPQEVNQQTTPNYSKDDIASVGMGWGWKKERSQYEPVLKESRFVNSTLFDLSSHYFKGVIEMANQRSVKNPEKMKLFRSLGEIRLDFEKDGNEVRLRTRQQKLFANFKKPVEK